MLWLAMAEKPYGVTGPMGRSLFANASFVALRVGVILKKPNREGVSHSFSLLTRVNRMFTLCQSLIDETKVSLFPYIYSSYGGPMFEVTATATQQIAEYFKGKELMPIRIFLNSGG
jgi:hypothetical protein